ncbi:MAG TPA: hypothetical protein VHG71_06110 [Verrucomicrobiae bacterium]|nr:hypothetical protein [Verrucomicrobiae bacterium]
MVKIIFVGALIALGIWLWTIFFPKPETIVRQRILKLAKIVSFTKGEGNFSRVAAGERVGGFFSTNVEINITIPGHESDTLHSRAEITQAALQARQAVRELVVKVPDTQVTLAPDKQSAVADVTVDVEISGERDAIVQEMKFTFQKMDGNWLITKIETVRTLN